MDAVEIDTAEEVQNDDAIDTTVPEVCRVCLLGNLMMRDLFVENEVVSLSTKAMSFASVKMLPGDGLPGQVCCDCADKLDSAYEFKLQVEQADNVLRQRYDSLNIKEELFFNEVEVHLEGDRGVHTLDVDEHYQATVDSLTCDAVEDEKSSLLKDHLALLQVQKLAEAECAAAADQKHSNEIAEESNVEEMLEATADHDQYLDANEENCDEIADCQMYGQSVKEEAMHGMEGMAIDEHNYIMQQGYALERTEEQLESQETVDSVAHESTEYLTLMDEEMNPKDDTNNPEVSNSTKTDGLVQQSNPNVENTPTETRRSKRRLLKRNTDEENYFENLNLSSRLKKGTEKMEKIYFLCYLCDKQFVSKNILKEHMHSHEEVRRTLSLKKTEKLDKRHSPTKYGTAKTSSLNSTPTSSGKKSNKCPYCGKEYLYVISFNKHLKQHEKNKDSARDPSSMTFDESTRGDDDSSNLAGYEDDVGSETNGRVKLEKMDEGDDNDDDDVNPTKRQQSVRSNVSESLDKSEPTFETKKLIVDQVVNFRCSTCDLEFDDLDKLRRHRSEHVVDGVLSEQDIETDVYDRDFDDDAPDDGPSGYDPEDEQRRQLETADDDRNVSKLMNEDEWQMNVEPDDVDGFASKERMDTTEDWSQSNDQKFSNPSTAVKHEESSSSNPNDRGDCVNHVCKICKQTFARKEQLQRHVDQHVKTKSFDCDECKKIFGNELTLRNHLIATNHRTKVCGEIYDPNKRMKRVAAKAAQKIIDKIKKQDFSDDDANEESEILRLNVRRTRNDEKIHPTASSRKVQHRNRRRCDFECESCGRKCSSKQSLAKHMEQHRVKEEKFDATSKTDRAKKIVFHETNDRSGCDGHKKIFPRNDRTSRNDRDDDDENSDFESGLDWPMDNHKCPTCKKKYSTKKSLLRHQLLHEEPNFECDICNVKFYRKDKLKSHYDKCSEKNPDQVRKCNICGDKFENNDMLKEHRGKHVDEGILTEDDLRDTEPEDSKDGGKIVRKRRTDIVGLECTECNKHYTSRKGLLRHIQVHEGKKYLCDICPKKFYRREHLKIHVAKHNMIKPYKCSRCTKRFIKEDQLANHLSKHDRNFKKTKETDSSKRFLCEICSKSFTQSTTLIAHLRAHNGIKPYVCEVCARPFTTNAYLKMHMRTHTQERPYSCQYCSRAFARADTLANHLTSHTGEAKYHCKYCPKNFRRLKSLKEHVFIHTGQRPYSCPTCDRRFNNNGSRYAHSKRCKQNMLQNQNRSQNVQHAIVQNSPQHIRIHQLTGEHVAPVQVVKSQNIKTITIARPSDQIGGHQVMQHQELLMPLILPLTVTLTDVDEEVILPEGTKIFTTA